MKQVKENFCGACVSIPLTLAGSAIGSYSTKPHSYKKNKNIQFLVGLLFTFITFSIGYYLLYVKECSACIK